MNRVLPLALAALLAVGCTFERRPPVESDGAGSDEGADGRSALVSARAFVEELQGLRASGPTDDLRRRIHPDAVLLLDGRPVARGGADGEAGASPPLSLRDRSWRLVLEDASMPGGAVLFVLRYPADGGAPAWIETLLVSRDTADWAVRLLHRETAAGIRDGPPSP